jgi:NDP-sugar pyrophosphorylase family protein
MPESLDAVDVVILAGGQGTRLGALPGDVPKPLRSVDGRPFLEHLFDQLRAAGATKVLLSLGFKNDHFETRFRKAPPQGLDVRFSVEKTALGTAGGLRNALPLLSRPTVLVLNGDSYADTDLRPLLERHRALAAKATILVTRVPDASRFGRVQFDPSGAVTGFLEKSEAGPGFVNAGVYALERSVIERVPAGRAVSLERQVFPGLVGDGLFAHAAFFPFVDIGTPESYKEADTFFKRKRSP